MPAKETLILPLLCFVNHHSLFSKNQKCGPECRTCPVITLPKIINAKAPMINKKVVNRKNDFITIEITNLRRMRRKAERKYRKSKSEEDLKIFKDLVARVSRAVKDSRNEYYTNKLLDCKNGRETFQIVNKVLNKETTARILPTHQNDEKLCNEFEQFFHDKIDKKRKDIAEEISEYH